MNIWWWCGSTFSVILSLWRNSALLVLLIQILWQRSIYYCESRDCGSLEKPKCWVKLINLINIIFFCLSSNTQGTATCGFDDLQTVQNGSELSHVMRCTWTIVPQTTKLFRRPNNMEISTWYKSDIYTYKVYTTNC